MSSSDSRNLNLVSFTQLQNSKCKSLVHFISCTPKSLIVPDYVILSSTLGQNFEVLITKIVKVLEFKTLRF